MDFNFTTVCTLWILCNRSLICWPILILMCENMLTICCLKKKLCTSLRQRCDSHYLCINKCQIHVTIYILPRCPKTGFSLCTQMLLHVLVDVVSLKIVWIRHTIWGFMLRWLPVRNTIKTIIFLGMRWSDEKNLYNMWRMCLVQIK